MSNEVGKRRFMKQKNPPVCFRVPVDQALGTAAAKPEPLVFTCPKLPRTSVLLREGKASSPPLSHKSSHFKGEV